MTPKEQQIADILTSAIKGNNLIEFKYDNEYRTVEPFLFGELYNVKQSFEQEGKYALRAWLVRGYSSLPVDIRPGDRWRKYELKRIMDITILNETYKIVRPLYNPNDQEFKRINYRINVDITKLEANIDAYINEINKTNYCTFDADKIQTIIKELVLAKDLPLEKMQVAFDKLKKETDADILKIGSEYAGGIVIYLDKTGNHGLVCADKDFGEAIWGADVKIGADGNGIADGSGMKNTKKIVELASWVIVEAFFINFKKSVPTAASLCLESNHNGYNDWYLPTKTELNLIYENKDKVGGFADDYYWSSAGYNTYYAWIQYFGNGVQSYGDESGKCSVRAVRAF